MYNIYVYSKDISFQKADPPVNPEASWPPPPPSLPKLPSGWKALKDSNGLVYFHNINSG